jgi:hypothetical protein
MVGIPKRKRSLEDPEEGKKEWRRRDWRKRRGRNRSARRGRQ